MAPRSRGPIPAASGPPGGGTRHTLLGSPEKVPTWRPAPLRQRLGSVCKSWAGRGRGPEGGPAEAPPPGAASQWSGAGAGAGGGGAGGGGTGGDSSDGPLCPRAGLAAARDARGGLHRPYPRAGAEGSACPCWPHGQKAPLKSGRIRSSRRAGPSPNPAGPAWPPSDLRSGIRMGLERSRKEMEE